MRLIIISLMGAVYGLNVSAQDTWANVFMEDARTPVNSHKEMTRVVSKVLENVIVLSILRFVVNIVCVIILTRRSTTNY